MGGVTVVQERPEMKSGAEGHDGVETTGALQDVIGCGRRRERLGLRRRRSTNTLDPPQGLSKISCITGGGGAWWQEEEGQGCTPLKLLASIKHSILSS